jgi:hypothetical protein
MYTSGNIKEKLCLHFTHSNSAHQVNRIIRSRSIACNACFLASKFNDENCDTMFCSCFVLCVLCQLLALYKHELKRIPCRVASSQEGDSSLRILVSLLKSLQMFYGNPKEIGFCLSSSFGR